MNCFVIMLRQVMNCCIFVINQPMFVDFGSFVPMSSPITSVSLTVHAEMALLKQGREDMCSKRYGVTPTAAISSSATKLLCDTDTVVPTKSFANYAQDVAAADPPEFKRAVKKKSKLIIGAANGNSSLKSVQTIRTIDVFVSRLHPDTANNELIDCIQESKGDICVSDLCK